MSSNKSPDENELIWNIAEFYLQDYILFVVVANIIKNIALILLLYWMRGFLLIWNEMKNQKTFKIE